MTVFRFDMTFDGLLTAVFEAYAHHLRPDRLAGDESLPLFDEVLLTVETEGEKAGRVWSGLEKKLSSSALRNLTQTWLAEESDTPTVLFRYICKVFDTSRSIETDFADPDVLAFVQMWRRVRGEATRLVQFIRFQKVQDGTYFAAVEPEKNAVPLVLEHFKDRFRDQRWVIYDLSRAYGFYYDGVEIRQVTFADADRQMHLQDGRLSEEVMDKDELLFQQLWKTYFKAIAIKERWNPRKHRQDMPVRYWKHLTEKQ